MVLVVTLPVGENIFMATKFMLVHFNFVFHTVKFLVNTNSVPY